MLDFDLDTENTPDFTEFTIEFCSDLSDGLSGNSCVSTSFQVNHFDICWLAEITAPNFITTRLDAFVGDNYIVNYTAAESTSTVSMNCGSIQYELWYASDTLVSTVLSSLGSLRRRFHTYFNA